MVEYLVNCNQTKITNKKLEDNLKKLQFNSDEEWINKTIDKIGGIDMNYKENYTEYDKLDRFYLFIKNIMSRKKVIFIGGIVITSISIIVLGGFLASRFLFNRLDVNKLTLEEKRDILASVIKNNSTSLLNGGTNRNNSLASLAGDANAETKLNSSLIYPDFERNYTYRYSKVDYVKGDALSLCKQFNNVSNQPDSTENYEYFNDTQSYYKYIGYKDNTLVDYYLSKSNTDSSETIEYKGGSYAIRWSYSSIVNTLESEVLDDFSDLGETVEEVPSSEPTDVDLVTMYFGENADVVGSTNINGNEYYIIQYSYNTNCDDNMFYPLYDLRSVSNEVELKDTIIVQNVVNPSNFEIVENKNYLGSVSESNLINQFSSTIITSNQDFSEVSLNFEFDLEIEVRDYTYPEYNALNEATNLVSYLSNNDFKLLTLNNRLTSAYSNIASQNLYANSNYLSDRNFYVEGSLGDEMYNLYNYTDNYTYSYLSLSYLIDESTYQTLNIDLYDKDADLTDIMGLNSIENEIVSSIKVKIDGNDENATLYEYTPDYSIYSESISSDMSLPVNNTEYVVKYLTVEYNNYKYLIFVSDKNINLESLSFVSLDVSDDVELSSLSEKIIDAYTNYLTGSSAEAL